MSTTRIVLFSVAAATVVGGASAAWAWWPPVIRYRIRVNDKRVQGIALAYVQGRTPLESSASAVADLWLKDQELQLRLEWPSSSGGGSLTAVAGVPPPGVRADDPRLKALGDRAMDLMLERTIGHEAMLRFRRERAKGHDST